MKPAMRKRTHGANCGNATARAKKFTPVTVDPRPYQHAGAAVTDANEKASVIIVLIALGT
jgi:hypothetical protein